MPPNLPDDRTPAAFVCDASAAKRLGTADESEGAAFVCDASAAKRLGTADESEGAAVDSLRG